ncbi:hypothetical protein SAMN05421823_102277 [Catalinimonas alkaloidigena]|uniref:RiboL-PSP-HEPN domain-containing protein n=1 Tax=Catalinimonas alkaloidigena TaxID=1075417 RepID=A0A1G9AF59_9BACT|nr:hypothetical protein [Catalinimonas alkaloidigena]SDK25873.1 hypothetical protein SAMN05421823_102277 [Catalinimonas alkaloidigena]
MNTFERIQDKVEEYKKYYNKRKPYPINNFIAKVNIAKEVNVIVEKNTNNQKAKIEARKNYVINLVTALEVFIKDSIKKRGGLFGNDNQRDLLKEKISLYEAHQLFKHKDLKTEEIIAIYYSFQSLESIDYVLSKLMGKSFLKEAGAIEIDITNTHSNYFKSSSIQLNKDYPEWQKNIAEVFERRHSYVHDLHFNTILGKKRLNYLTQNFIAFTIATEEIFRKTENESFEYIMKWLEENKSE